MITPAPGMVTSFVKYCIKVLVVSLKNYDALGHLTVRRQGKATLTLRRMKQVWLTTIGVVVTGLQ